MLPYLRRFRGWDWFTPREVRHLHWRERERLIQEAQEAVVRHPRFRLFRRLLLVGSLIMFIASGIDAAAHHLLNLNMILFWSPIFLLLDLLFMVLIVTFLVSNRKHFRQELRQKMFDAGIRPAFCFECGHELEGSEGKACPACHAPLLQQADSPPERS